MVRRTINAMALLAGLTAVLGIYSCIVGIRGNLGPFSLPNDTAARIRNGVVSIRHITAYDHDAPVADGDWHDPVNHPERVMPMPPGFPWFGFSDGHKTGVAMIPDRASIIIPADYWILFFPIWLPAMLLVTPLLWRMRGGRNKKTIALVPTLDPSFSLIAPRRQSEGAA